MLEKAASLYIKSLQFKLAAPLISMIKSPNLLKQYAKAKESEGKAKIIWKKNSLKIIVKQVHTMKLSRLMSKQSHGKVSLDIDLFAVWELMKY